MKRILVFAVALVLTSLLYAEEGQTAPTGVVQIEAAAAYTSAGSAWDQYGVKQAIGDLYYFPSDGYHAISMGGALELGLLDWLSASVRWTPAWNLWSTFVNAPAPFDRATMNGAYDVFVSARFQVVGRPSLGLVVEPEVKLPASSPKWAVQDNLASTGESWIFASPDKHTLGVGLAASLEVAVTRAFLVDAYGELIVYGDKYHEDASWETWRQHELMLPEWSVVWLAYGFDLSGTVEPAYELTVSDGVALKVAVPVTFRKSPEVKHDGEVQTDSDSYLLTVTPTVSVALATLEVQLAYTVPLLGKNADAAHAIGLALRRPLELF